jgi:hypothetical protein
MPAARWLRGTTVQGSIVYARTSNGRNRRVAQYNQEREEWIVTRRGRQYYDEYPVDFTVNVPVIAMIWKKNTRTARCTTRAQRWTCPIFLWTWMNPTR